MRSKFIISTAVAAAFAFAVPAQAQVTNGGFETGDFSGWTLSGDTGFTGVTSGPTYVHSGTYGAYFGPVGATGTLSQILTTVPGETYTITFWLHNDGGSPNSFEASFDGNVLTSLTNAPADAYSQYTYSAIASTASTTLAFTFRQDPNFWGLDDVAVTNAVPEPATWAMMLLGFGAIGIASRRRRKTTALRTTG